MGPAEEEAVGLASEKSLGLPDGADRQAENEDVDGEDQDQERGRDHGCLHERFWATDMCLLHPARDGIRPGPGGSRRARQGARRNHMVDELWGSQASEGRTTKRTLRREASGECVALEWWSTARPECRQQSDRKTGCTEEASFREILECWRIGTCAESAGCSCWFPPGG